VAAAHVGDTAIQESKKAKKRMASRLYYHARKAQDSEFGKKKYRREKELDPEINKKKYRKALARDPDFNRKKRAKKTGIPVGSRKPNSVTNSQEKAAIKKARERRKYLASKERRIANVVKRQRQRYQTDPEYMLLIRLRSRIRYAVRAGAAQKKGNCRTLIGCNATEFCSYIESLFAPGMSWQNKQEWHIDHIIPVSAFDLTSEEGQQAAFHYTNMRPLWAHENIKKGAKPPTAQRRFEFGYLLLADEQKSRARKGGQVTERRRA
jgi:hypothetical protein